MSDSEKPKSWKERRQSIKHKWHVPFVFPEWLCERFSYFLGRWAFLDILGHAGRLAILVAVISYIWGYPERQRQAEDQRKAKHYQAWQIINAAEGKSSSGGRIEALQDLNKDKVSLGGIDISKAFLFRINLEDADLGDANLTEATLTQANLAESYLFGANLFRASLMGADLTGADLMTANLTEARFLNTNLSEAFLYEANLSNTILDVNLAEANLNFANLTGAVLSNTNLAGAHLVDANLTNIYKWQDIESIENANIYGVKNPPDGFIEWAKEHGAVSTYGHEFKKEYLERRQKKREKQRK